MIKLALKELIEMHASYKDGRWEGANYPTGYLSGLEDAIEVLENFIAAGKRDGVMDKTKDVK